MEDQHDQGVSRRMTLAWLDPAVADVWPMSIQLHAIEQRFTPPLAAGEHLEQL